MAFGSGEILPTHNTPLISVRNCSSLRWKERHFFYLILFSFTVFFVCGFFFLPELKAGTQFAYKRIRHSDLLSPLVQPQIKPPYLADPDVPFHQGFAPPPIALNHDKDASLFYNKIGVEGTSGLSKISSFQPNEKIGPLEAVPDWKPLPLPTGEDADPEIRHRRDTVREMAQHAWSNYVKYSWGENELKPLSKRGFSTGIFGSTRLGATIVDSINTLYIMGLKEEYNQARNFVANELNLDDIDSELSVFEMNIRFVGGLLSIYALTKDPIYLTKAEQLAKHLLIAFDTPTGIPNAIVNPKQKYSKNYIWASSGSSILSEFGSMHLEFVYLSQVTGNPIYREKVVAVRNYLDKIDKVNGLYPNYLNPINGQWGQHHFTVGALGDSFYEYLIKSWWQTNGEDAQARRMYEEAMDAIIEYMLKQSHGGLSYFGERKYDHTENKMDHLACFIGGAIGLGSLNHTKSEMRRTHMEIASNVTHTCHESYARSATKLGPESFRFTREVEARAIQPRERYYILRPEVIESYFVMWRLTKDKRYRDWAWEATMALQNHCRTESGFSGIRNVYDPNGPKDDVQQSFVIAETFKYLYLIFSDDSLIPLDKWVFNTEAHPLPVKGHNPAYPTK